MMDKNDTVGDSKEWCSTCDDDLSPSPPAMHNFSVDTTGGASDSVLETTQTTENQPSTNDIRRKQGLVDTVEQVKLRF